MLKVNIFNRWFQNNFDPNIIITVFESGYLNDWIVLQWIKHFDQFSAKYKRGRYRHLFINKYGFYLIRKFFTYTKEYDIIVCPFFPHIIHLLQPFDVCIF